MADDKAQFESRESAVTEGVSSAGHGLVKMWLAAIKAADDEEKDWRQEADEIVAIYRSASTQEKNQAFNILYSNTETALPAVYNSTPVPDIRRRYNDPGPASKAVADMLERAITFSVDQYDFDAVIRAVVFDAIAPGRGVARVRYNAEVNDDAVSGETVTCEYVPWKNFRRGPGLVWNDVDWIAFKHYLSREQLVDLAGEIGNELALDHDTRTGDKPDKDGKDPSDVFLRACVWEIWDKMSKKVLFIAPCYPEKPIREEDDPLQLTGFFPIPKPIQPLDTPCDLVPVPPYRAYKHLAEELNEVTIRIKRLVRQIKVRGIYASSAASIEQIVTADDGELVAAAGLEFLADGGLDKAIAWWPIDPQVNAIKQLVEHREAIKTTIYEVSGLADIMRGNSNAQETLGAQQIKAQWGSLRIQRVQADVQRFCRDLFRMKAELIAQRFDIAMLQEMTGIKLASQQDKMMAQQAAQQAQQMQQPPPDGVEEVMEAPSLEEAEQIMRSDLVRAYRIDVETDSTVRADLTRNQEQMVQFVQGTAGYIQAIAPAIQGGMLPPELALTIYGAFARNFKLGRQVDVALDKAAEDAQEAAKQPPAPPPPDPNMVKVEMEAKAREQELGMKREELQMNAQMQAAKMQMEQQAAEQKMMMEQQRFEQDAMLKQQTAEQDFALKRDMAGADIQLKREQFSDSAKLARSKMALDYKAAKVPVETADLDEETEDPFEEVMKKPLEDALAPVADALAQMAQAQAQAAEAQAQTQAQLADALAQMAQAMQMMSAPKRVVRDRTGQVVGTETVLN
jgi:hypothetical protein